LLKSTQQFSGVPRGFSIRIVSRDQMTFSQLLEELKEAFICRLVGGKAQLTTLGHVRYDFNWPPKIPIGVPR
jgi:hypothetical protein